MMIGTPRQGLPSTFRSRACLGRPGSCAASTKQSPCQSQCVCRQLQRRMFCVAYNLKWQKGFDRVHTLAALFAPSGPVRPILFHPSLPLEPHAHPPPVRNPHPSIHTLTPPHASPPPSPATRLLNPKCSPWPTSQRRTPAGWNRPCPGASPPSIIIIIITLSPLPPSSKPAPLGPINAIRSPWPTSQRWTPAG